MLKGKSIIKWVDQRYEVTKAVDFMLKKKVPVSKHSFWLYFGGVSLFFFIIQVLTGMLLLLYYRVGEDSSFESMQLIVTKVKFGWLIRSIHSWSANLMVFAVIVHMFSVYFTKTFRKPRELSWVTGMILLLLSVTFGFSGYLLPWNELAYFATKVGTDMVGSIPVIGHDMLVILRGSDTVDGATLSRFFGLHVAILPGIFTVVLAIHLIFVQVQGMSDPVEWRTIPVKERRYMPFFPNFALKDLLLWLIVLNILALLAVFFPMELGVKADAFASAPAGIKPEWYFMFMFQTLKYVPPHVFFLEGEFFGLLMFGIMGVIWFLVPFWDSGEKSKYGNTLLNVLGVLLIIYVIVLTVIGYLE